ncbi:MAG: tRNA 2-thiouridine(34) synthase MnmA [Candidatus Omnitrophota bacterium]|nr:tRNA 2-thiouridine(34) synthase MnmA [Candidatus Omnitrophota bacterium]
MNQKKLKKERKRIAVAMSGGVDSSLAAALLKKEGYQVIGITFRMWPKEECGASVGRSCCNLEAVTRARAVAGDLGIPYYVFDFSEEFKKKVIDYFCDQYLKGFTPNPCVVCNEKIKFGLLHEKALALDADLVATGHYARLDYNKKRGRFILKVGKGGERDQTYFLFSLSQNQLKYTIFPLAGYTKEKTRILAKKFKLITFNTASSQDICFIQDQNYAEYIKKKTGVEIKEGSIVDLSGKVLGRHKGIPFYTIGQRRGLGVAYKEPLYVVAIDRLDNKVIVGTKKDVLKKSLVAHSLNWIAIDGIDKPIKVKAKIRYNHKAANALVTPVDTDMVRVDFESPQEAPTPGQAVVFYDKEIVVGGGWIKEVV